MNYPGSVLDITVFWEITCNNDLQTQLIETQYTRILSHNFLLFNSR